MSEKKLILEEHEFLKERKSVIKVKTIVFGF